MPAAKIHAVLTKADSIALGTHHVPMTNIMHCVLNALHNVIVSSFTTNADHEPARLILLKILQFVGISLVDPHSTSEGLEIDSDFEPSQFLDDRLPDLLSRDGIIDLLALRSFAIIFLALATKAYASLRDGVLSVSEAICREVESTWTVVAALDRFINYTYTINLKRKKEAIRDYDQAAMVSTCLAIR